MPVNPLRTAHRPRRNRQHRLLQGRGPRQQARPGRRRGRRDPHPRRRRVRHAAHLPVRHRTTRLHRRRSVGPRGHVPTSAWPIPPTCCSLRPPPHTLAKLAQGLGEDLLSVTALAATCPLALAPAMDAGMFTHAATQANLRILQERGALVIGPEEGRLASGLVAKGRMTEPAAILGQVRYLLSRQGPLASRRAVVTAGGTRELLDPVRFLGNRSSGSRADAAACRAGYWGRGDIDQQRERSRPRLPARRSSPWRRRRRWQMPCCTPSRRPTPPVMAARWSTSALPRSRRRSSRRTKAARADIGAQPGYFARSSETARRERSPAGVAGLRRRRRICWRTRRPSWRARGCR